MIMDLRYRRKLRNLSRLHERVERKASEPDVCPNAGREHFTPDKARYCLATRYYGTCTTFKLKLLSNCPRFKACAQ
jgi:hypothetical protein